MDSPALARFGEIGLADHPLEHPYLLHNVGYVATRDPRLVLTLARVGA